MWTKVYIVLVIISLCVIVQYNVTYAKRILIISSYPSFSHQITYRGLCLELHRQGHEIVSVTTNPMKNSSLTNYTEIDLHYFYNGFPEYKNLMYTSVTKASLELQLLEFERELIWAALHILNREVFKNPEMKRLYAADSNEHFDAVIVAQGPTISLNALAYRFNAPLIGNKKSLLIINKLRKVRLRSIFLTISRFVTAYHETIKDDMIHRYFKSGRIQSYAPYVWILDSPIAYFQLANQHAE